MKNLFADFIKFQKECPPLDLNSKVSVKMKTGGSYTFSYTDLAEIHKTVKPILAKNGLGFVQIFDNTLLITKLIHSSGEVIESSFDISPYIKNASSQDTGGIITYFKRYTLTAILGLTSEADDDANASLGNETKYDKDDMPKKWMSKEQFAKFLKLEDKTKLSDIITGFSFSIAKDKEGKETKYCMSKDYSAKLKERLNTLK